MEIKKIYEEKPIGKEISVKGWIRKHRKQKEIGFIELSDGTCFKKIQVVYDSKLSDFEEMQKIKFGSSIEVIGVLEKSPISEELELQAKKVILIGDCDDDYPIQPKRHTREFLRQEAYL